MYFITLILGRGWRRRRERKQDDETAKMLAGEEGFYLPWASGYFVRTTPLPGESPNYLVLEKLAEGGGFEIRSISPEMIESIAPTLWRATQSLDE
ncbi:MAG: hypothetical protein WC451_04035 [Patescibacteria group bacterium]